METTIINRMLTRVGRQRRRLQQQKGGRRQQQRIKPQSPWTSTAVRTLTAAGPPSTAETITATGIQGKQTAITSATTESVATAQAAELI